MGGKLPLVIKKKNPAVVEKGAHLIFISPGVGGGISTLRHSLPTHPLNKLTVIVTQEKKKSQLCLAVSLNMFYLQKYHLITNITLVVGWR